MKTVRVNFPAHKNDKTIKLGEKVIARHALLGAASPLNGVLDMVAFGAKVTNAKNLRKQGGDSTEDRHALYGSVKKACGLAEGQTRDNEGTVYWWVQKVRNLLRHVHIGNEESLSPYGYNVVVSQTGARRNVRIKLPLDNPDDMIMLGEEIIDEHTTLGAGSPLTGQIDMVAFGAITGSARTLYTDWDTAKGDGQAFNNEALGILGYAEGQTVYTAGTIYFDLALIRDHLLDVFQGDEDRLSQWGFDVVIGHTRRLRAGSLVILQGLVPAGASLNIETPDIDAAPTLPAKFEALFTTLRFYASATPGAAPGPATVFFDVVPGTPALKTVGGLLAELGLGEALPYLTVQNIGAVEGSYKITIG